MSNDGTPCRVGNDHQGNYGDHQLSYFDTGMATQTHARISSISEPTEIDLQSHPLQSTEGSPPPNSATTSGSSGSTSSTLGISDQPQGSTPTKYSVSVTDGMLTKPFDDTDTSGTTATHTEKSVDVPISHPQEMRTHSASYQSAIKLMVSNNVAGSIIGRQGQTISELQSESSARIKLSQTGDYFPGTQDRICLVQGQVEPVKHAARLLLERFYSLQEHQHTQHLAWQPRKGTNVPTGFDFVVRLLVPSSSCGMIIGKGGSNIKQMEERSGVSSVRLSPKESSDQTGHQSMTIGSGTLERVVTLTGPTLQSCVSCLFNVIDIMHENHEISRYTNMTTSYSRHVTQGSYSSLQPGRHLHIVQSSTADWESQGPYGSVMVRRSTSQPDLSHLATDQQRRVNGRLTQEAFGGSISQHHLGQREPPVQQFNPSFVDSSQAYNGEVSSMLGGQDRTQRSNNAVGPMYLLGSSTPNHLDPSTIQGSTSAPDLLALQFQDTLRLSNSQTGGTDYSHFAPQIPQPTRPGFTAQVYVPDNLIGSILGRGGSTLNELMYNSNTRIRISQRGEYVPGTRDRIVTIRGQTAQSVNFAQMLMSQRMVLPPTAGFAGQQSSLPSPYLHPPPIQEPIPQRIPLQQSTQAASVDSTGLSAIPLQQQALTDGPFLSSGSHTPATTPGPSINLTLKTTDNDNISSHR